MKFPVSNSRLVACAIAGALTYLVLLSAPAYGGVYSVVSCRQQDQDYRFSGWAYENPSESEGLWGNAYCNEPDQRGFAIYNPLAWLVPIKSHAGWIFTAPPGTEIVGLDALTRVTDDGPLPSPRSPLRQFWDPDNGRELANDAAIRAGGFYVWSRVSIRTTVGRRIGFGYRCPNGDSCFLDESMWLAMKDVAVWISDSQPPSVSVEGDADAWFSKGVVPVRFLATDNVGIRLLTVSGDDGNLAAYSGEPCYLGPGNLDVAPCSQVNGSVVAEVDVDSLTSGPHDLRVSATDPGGLQTDKTFRVLVDKIPPAAPRRLSLTDGGSWRNENRFGISWTSPKEDGSVAPIVGAEYEFCPAANGAYDNAGCVRSSTRISDATDQSDVLAVPSDGSWTLRVSLTDAAGNTDPGRPAVLEPLNLDSERPLGSFEAFDPNDPGRLQFSASDALSGIDHVDIELRRAGENVWRALSVTGTGTGGLFSALIDDSALPKGVYDVRARVLDRAGNDRYVTDVRGGGALRVSLPIRSTSSMLVGHPSRVRVKSARGSKPRYRRVLVARPVAEFGSSVTIEGKLTDAAGNPRPEEPVEVLERVDLPGRDWRYLAIVRTTRSGDFEFKAIPGSARRLRFVYPGTPLSQPSAEEVEVRVRAAISVRPNHRRLHNGDTVEFSGRLVSGPLPEAGKLLALQALTRRGWRTFANPRARAADGKWRWRYRFTGTVARTNYAFRVVVPTESGYPYAQGRSKVTRVLVNP